MLVCTCKSNVTGQYCDQCPSGYFNLTSNNPLGCERCKCYVKGTVNGDRTRPDLLPCGNSDGQCSCLSNVKGKKCQQCNDGYVWNQNGQGCITCR